ncbi:MAG: 4a-hydroxytetrahydrobiopterin dehydratase [Frankiales bacterium]|nr:4a-hydroxytetrahydrobiopterin dehydratase [Frankiales bacterium]
MAAALIPVPEISTRPELADWRYVLGAIATTARCGSFTAAADLALQVAAEADRVDHHPDLDLRYPDLLQITLSSHDAGGVTERDARLAVLVSELIARTGARVEPLRRQAVEFAIDTINADRIRPFWAAVLGYDEYGGALVDPLRIGPPMWFQQMDEPRTERSRFHIDVSVAHDLADDRVAAAVAAGGRLVTDAFARAWWVLADADGNEACVCTWQDRD